MNEKDFVLKRKLIVCIPKITRVQQATAFSTVLYKNDVTDRPNSFSTRLTPRLFYFKQHFSNLEVIL